MANVRYAAAVAFSLNPKPPTATGSRRKTGFVTFIPIPHLVKDKLLVLILTGTSTKYVCRLI